MKAMSSSSSSEPELSRWYAAYFGDIYMLNRQMLPELDIATLFHLCEFRTEQNDSYGALTDRQVLNLLTEKLRPGGLMMFFPGSYAFAKAEPVIKGLGRDRKRRLSGGLQIGPRLQEACRCALRRCSNRPLARSIASSAIVHVFWPRS